MFADGAAPGHAARCAVALVALLTAALAGCAPFENDWSTLHPAGSVAQSVSLLWWVMCVGALLLWAGVAGAFVWLARERGQPLHTTGEGRWLFWGAVVLPALVLVPLVAYGLVVGERVIRAQGFAGEPLHVNATARQWAWQFDYPDIQPGVAHTTLYLPAGRPIRFEIRSEDVIHSLWIPRLGGKLDAIPGRTNVMVLDARAPGRYGGQCAEFCGTGHTAMRFEVVVEPEADFLARLTQARP
ncbi:MAG: cytochrome c oxidase subunit II [Pseudomonadota bacterium]|nr:cytochrome c oxidase subunit II [Pseudomonadota bacterium]